MRDARGAVPPEVARFEPLEPRLLLNAALPVITSIDADNRGLVVLTASRDLQSFTVNNGSVRLYTAGADGLLGTDDDVLANRQVFYNPANRQISISTSLAADTRYRVVLDASIIRGTNGFFLDGEFNGVGVATGDGVEGGDLEFFTRRAVTTIARFSTVLGTIDVRLFGDVTPLTVQNFLNYANSGVWDSTFFHRGARASAGQGPADFVIQGGGFDASTNALSQIPQGPPVLNEPGISNLRGTIAMAKLGNDPNSATNQWFFNIGNNSANLDAQNGGFTVFGEVLNASGLAVMDAISALERFNASAQNGAFNEIPVIDINVVQARGSVIPSDLARFTRIAVLMDLTGEPTQQLPIEGSVTVTSEDGRVTVRVFDLDGVGLPAAESFLSVTFGSRDAVSRIQFLDSFPNARVGVQITGASRVGQIIDQRRSATGDVAFIVSNAEIGTLRMTQPVTGFNLNGFVLPGGVQLDEDIDGDGRFNDPLAVLVQSGRLGTLDLRSSLNGDVVAEGGVQRVVVRGDATNANFVSRGTGGGVAQSSYQFAGAYDVAINSANPITTISATEWRSIDPAAETIRAPSVGTIRTTGNRSAGIAGDFEASLNLSGTDRGRTLNSANIAGGLFRANWVIAGDAGPVTVRGDASLWNLTVGGNAGNFNAASVLASSISAGGRLGAVRVVQWDGGSIAAQSGSSITTTGNRRDGIAGDFSADITMIADVNANANAVALNSLQVAGGFLGGEIDVIGRMNLLRVRGETRGLDFRSQFGDLRVVQLGDVRDSDILVVQGTMSRLTAVRWTGGSLAVNILNSVTMTGLRSDGIAGDFSGAFEATTLGSFTLSQGGSLFGSIGIGARAQSITITGNMTHSQITMGSVSVPDSPSLRTLTVGGTVDSSEIRSTLAVNTIRVGRMVNSGVYVGVPNTTFGLPDPGAQATTIGVLGRMEVRGLGDGSFGFENSFIVAGDMRSAFISEPRTTNFGIQHGVAGRNFGSVVTRINGQNFVVNTSTGSQAVGDYQVRVNFAIPGQAV